ncbi:MAG: hypothetical protein H6737_10475 [Alphaproteobacteria bacterium]|nr:hypothetical protein [Alphaproteobacteria bacterium]
MEYREVDPSLCPVFSVPMWEEALERAGFERVGYFKGVLDIDEVAEIYLEPDKTWFRENAPKGVPVFLDRSTHTWAEVSMFYDGPAVRLRTRVPEGVVETRLRWLRLPSSVLGRFGDRSPEDAQTRARSRGYDIAVVEGDADALLAAHRARVSAPVTTGAEVRDYIALCRALFGHEMACGRWQGRGSLAAVGAVGAGGLAVAAGCVVASVPYPWVPLVVAGGLLGLDLPRVVAVGRSAARRLNPALRLP